MVKNPKKLLKKLVKLDFSKFISLIINLKIINSIYTNKIVIDYYLILKS